MWKHTHESLSTKFRVLSSQASVHPYVLLLLQVAIVHRAITTDTPPVFVEQESNITATVGSTTELPCSVRHIKTGTVVWRKVGKNKNPLTVGEMVFVADTSIEIRHKKDNDIDMWNLVINNVTLWHSGRYVCQITTKVAKNRDVNLNVVDVNVPTDNMTDIVLLENEVRVPPVPSIVIAGTDYVAEGDEIKVACNVTGVDSLSFDMDWFMNGQKVQQDLDKGVSINTTYVHDTLHSVLTIAHGRSADKGLYVCRCTVTGSKTLLESFRVSVYQDEVVDRSTPNQRSASSATEIIGFDLLSWSLFFFAIYFFYN